MHFGARQRENWQDEAYRVSAMRFLGEKYYKSYLAGKQTCMRVSLLLGCGNWASPTVGPKGGWVMDTKLCKSFIAPRVYSCE